jgi:predicted lysophospholipase L1 biosynthesis ABC-type transport system permease subunit
MRGTGFPFPGKQLNLAMHLQSISKMNQMKRHTSIWLALFFLVTMVSSCQVVGGIFKAGFMTAIIIIVLVVGLILWLVGRGRR